MGNVGRERSDRTNDELADHDVYVFAYFMHHPPMMPYD